MRILLYDDFNGIIHRGGKSSERSSKISDAKPSATGGRLSKCKMIQRVGDRDKVAWSIKDYAFTIPSNPMSDRIQMVIEIWQTKEESGTKESSSP